MFKPGRIVLIVALCVAAGGGWMSRGAAAPDPTSVLGLVESRHGSIELNPSGSAGVTTTNVAVQFSGELASGSPDDTLADEGDVAGSVEQPTAVPGPETTLIGDPTILLRDRSTSTAVPTSVAPAPDRAVDYGAQLDDVAMSRISFDWSRRLPGWQIQFVGPRQGYRGSTFPDRRLIQIYVRPTATIDDVAHVVAHEIGHAIDVTYFDDVDRGRFNLARGRSVSAAWWVAPGATDFSSGAGDWAEAFAWAQVGPDGGWYSQLSPPPTAEQLGVIADLIAG